MSELWIWSVQTTSAPDVTGWDVVATDGEIGKIDEASYEAGPRVDRGRHRLVDLRRTSA